MLQFAITALPGTHGLLPQGRDRGILETSEVKHRTIAHLSSCRSSHVACLIANELRSEFSEFLEGKKRIMMKTHNGTVV